MAHSDLVLSISPCGVLGPSPRLVAEARRGGGLAVLDLASREPGRLAALRQAASWSGRNLGVRLSADCAATAADVREASGCRVGLVVLAAEAGWDIADTAWWARVLVEVTSQREARSAAAAAGASGLIACGAESGGWVGELSAFVLLQQLLGDEELILPVWATDGIGLHTAVACVVGGAAGVVLDSQLALMPESDLPFIALALAGREQSVAMLQATQALLGDRPWGVGILGFVDEELRAAQLEVVRNIKPSCAIIAGGRSAYAAGFEKDGMPAFLHVPSPKLLRQFLQAGSRRFVLEGAECGGHAGPRTSFSLWEAQLDVIGEFLESAPPDTAAGIQVWFAGGIHDARSAAMIAALAAPPSRRGGQGGLLMGTAYLFTREAVTSSAIQPLFQHKAVAASATALLETAPSLAIRCLATSYAADAGPLDVAVIGMACAFPGSPDLAGFWDLILKGAEAISDVPRERWDPAAGTSPWRNARGKRPGITAAGAFLGPLAIDPVGLGIPPGSLAAPAVSKGVLLPTLHCDDPHPQLEKRRFTRIAAARPWTGPGPRRAAVSAFGFGGINAHVILEQPLEPSPAVRGAAGRQPGPGLVGEPDQVMLLAAPSIEALSRLMDAGDDVVRDRSRQSFPEVANEPGPGCRLGIVDPTARSLAPARELLAKGAAWRGGPDVRPGRWPRVPGRLSRVRRSRWPPRRISTLSPGHGVQERGSTAGENISHDESLRP